MTETGTNITFSIITPTCNRESQLKRACQSVIRQTYEHWEHIIVDDGSNNDVQNLLGIMYPKDKIQYVRHDERTERLISFNDGMKVAKNDWIVFLDDDDEYMPMYLEYLAEAIKKNPDRKIFNYGGLVTNKNDGWIRVREPYPFEDKVGSELVQSGQIVNGQFAFHRSCLDTIGYFPEVKNCYEFADQAGIEGYDSKTRTLGNPWGQDFYIWYKLTRNWAPLTLPLYLYITHIRGTE